MKFFRQQTRGVTLPFQKHPAVKPLVVKQYTIGHSSREQRTQSLLAICSREPLLHMVQSILICLGRWFLVVISTVLESWSIQGISTFSVELPICIVVSC